MTTLQKELIVGSEITQDTVESSSYQEPIVEEYMHDVCLNMEPLSRIADGKTVRVPRNPHFTRKDVVQAFQSAFELIGGVPRLALWGHENQTEFYKLYARLLPSQASSALGESNTLKIIMDVPHSPLDE